MLLINMLKSILDFVFGDGLHVLLGGGLRQALALVSAFTITWLSIPSIVKLAAEKKLFDEPGHRKSHTHATPTLGGISIFAGLTISVLIFGRIPAFPQLQYVFAGLLVIFFIGLKDDIMGISPWKKLYGQVLAAFILIILGQIRITSLQGLFGINGLDAMGSMFISFFVIIVIVNAINLIDGIDGLASGLAIVAFATFGIWFYYMGASEYSVVAAAVVGSLISFSYFNVFGTTKKIFMGDTGSLMLGFLLAAFVIRFNELNIDPNTSWHVTAAPVVSFGILMIPLFDTARIFLLRVMRGGTPFKADRNHLHHLLLNLKLSHLNASLILITVNLLFILAVFKLQFLGMNWLLLIILLAGSLLSLGLHMLVSRRIRRHKDLYPPKQPYHIEKPATPDEAPALSEKPITELKKV